MLVHALIYACFCIGLYGERPPESQAPSQTQAIDASAPIREFDIDTLAKLGRDLYRHDQLAWQATDLVAEQIGLERLQAEGARGWVIDDSGPSTFVRFLRERDGVLEASCDVQFPLMGKPIVVIPGDRSITPWQAVRILGRKTALQRISEGQFQFCPVARGSYNFVLLDDPSGNGFLFYLLRPKETMASVPVGGHYRLSLTADGKSVTRVDRLSNSCLALERPAEGKAEALWMNHVVSGTPLETHVFLSLQEGLPFFVSTVDKRLWKVAEGKIHFVESLESPSATNSSAALKVGK